MIKLYNVELIAPAVHRFLLELLADNNKTIFDAILTQNNQSAVKDSKQRLTAVLLALTPTSSMMHQELLLAILTRFKVMVKFYLAKFSCVFDPRPSLKWFSNASLITRVLNIDLPASSDILPAEFFMTTNSDDTTDGEGDGEMMTVEQALDNVLPASLSKAFISKALQHSNKLVMFAALGLLSSMLRRFRGVVELLIVECAKYPAVDVNSQLMRLRLALLSGFANNSNNISFECKVFPIIKGGRCCI